MSALNITCPNPGCGATYELDESYVGKKVRCPQCEQSFYIERKGQGVVTKLRVRCPHCQTEYAVAPQDLGAVARCAACQKEFRYEVQSKGGAAAACPQPPEPHAAQAVKETMAAEPVRSDGVQAAGETMLAERAGVAAQGVGEAHVGTDPGQTIPAPGQPDAAAAKAPEEAISAEWKVGDVILDTYEVKQVHEGGGMGLVYRVHHRGWNMDLAVKSPRASYFQTEQQKENFTRECETWISLGLHPNIVSCHYVRTLGGIPRVFAEYVEGGSLKDWIESKKLYKGGQQEALKRILDIAIQFAWGLHYAHEHEQHLIHQDVKPANVLMTPDGTAKVTDFGLARARAAVGEAVQADKQRSILVSTGGMTPAYCSPEQANKQPLSRRTDIWSWGVSVLEMFVGEVCWQSGVAVPEVLGNYKELQVEGVAVPEMLEPLRELLQRCFAQDPEQRPRDMGEIAGTLKETYQQITGEAYPREEPKAAELLADGLNNKALSMLDLGRQREAEHLLEEALAKHTGHVQSTYNLGVWRWRSGRETDVHLLNALREVQRNAPRDWEVPYLIGQVHLEQGDLKHATVALQQAKKLGGNEEIRWALSEACSSPSQDSNYPPSFKSSRYDPDFEINSVALSRDNRLVLEGGKGGAPRLWDAITGRVLRTLVSDAADAITSVAFTWDGSFALSGYQGGVVHMWNVNTGQWLHTFHGHQNIVQSVAVRQDGRWVLSGSWDKTLRLWEVDTERCLRIFEGHTDAVRSVVISADGFYALSGSSDKTLRLWELASGVCVRTFEGHADQVMSVALSADGRWALSGSWDKTLRLWEVNTGRCFRIFEGHTNPIASVAMSADGHWALSGGFDKTLRLWEVSSRCCLRTFEGHQGVVSSVSLSSDSRYALSGSDDKTLRLWETGVGRGDRQRRRALPAICRFVAAGEVGEAQKQFDHLLNTAEAALASGRCGDAWRTLGEARSLPGYAVAPSALELSNRLGLHGIRKHLRGAWCLRTLEGHTEYVTSLAFSSDGSCVLSGSADHSLRLWAVPTGRCLRSFAGHKDAVRSIALSGDCRLALSGGGDLIGSKDNAVRLWEVETGRVLQEFQGHRYGITALALSGDCRLALSGSWDRTLRLWRVDTGHCLVHFEGLAADVTCVALSEHSRLALSGSGEKTIRVWDASTGICSRILKGHIDHVTSVVLSRNCRTALSGSGDRSLCLWDLASGRRVRSFMGHTGKVSSVALSADGRWALSGSSDKTLRLWEVNTGRCLRVFEGHTGPIGSVAMSQNGRWAVSASSDVRLWEMDWEYEFPDQTDWDGGAQPYLEVFLTLHCPLAEDGLTRIGKPVWTEEDFQKLLTELQYANYGWLRPAGVKKKLEEMTANWQDPPPLPWEDQEPTPSPASPAPITVSSRPRVPATEARTVQSVAPPKPQSVGQSPPSEHINAELLRRIAQRVLGERMVLKRLLLGQDAKTAVEAQMEKIRQEYYRALPAGSPLPSLLVFMKALSEVLAQQRAVMGRVGAKPDAPSPSQVAASAGTKPCSCGRRNPPGQAFCLQCGKSLKSPTTLRCAACQKDLPPGTVFCLYCGAKVAPAGGP